VYTVFAAERLLGIQCLMAAHFLRKDYANALRYLDTIKVRSSHDHDCSLATSVKNEIVANSRPNN